MVPQVKVRKERGQPPRWQTVALLLLQWTRYFSSSNLQRLSCAQHFSPWPVIMCLCFWVYFGEILGTQLQTGGFFPSARQRGEKYILWLHLQGPCWTLVQVISGGWYSIKYQPLWEKCTWACSSGKVCCFDLSEICSRWWEPVNRMVVLKEYFCASL